jgi:hypothetical protein
MTVSTAIVAGSTPASTYAVSMPGPPWICASASSSAAASMTSLSNPPVSVCTPAPSTIPSLPSLPIRPEV